MKKAWLDFLKSFQPTYSVTVSMYHVIPGRQVQKFDYREDFGKGELEPARKFYNNLINKHKEVGFPNSEIHLVKGKKTSLHSTTFGPVDLVKSLNVA